MKKVILIIAAVMTLASCGEKKAETQKSETPATETVEVEEVTEVVVDENVAAPVSAPSEDWDKILDEYESYCTKLATYAKKAQAGDVSALTEYASLLESAESLQKKLENAGSDLTAAQATRLNKIAAKMAKSMM